MRGVSCSTHGSVRRRPLRGFQRTSGTVNAGGIQLVDNVKLAVHRLLIPVLAVPALPLPTSHLPGLLLFVRQVLISVGAQSRRL